MGLFNYLKVQKKLRQIDISEEDDFVDLQFSIINYWQDENENHVCQVKGLWNKVIVGFEIAFRPDMQLGIIDGEVDKSRFYNEGVNFYSIGDLSDNFIKALIGLFKVDIQPLKMIDKIKSTTFVLSGHPENSDSGYIKTKIFFDDTEEKGFYSEWYVNVDLKNRILELREKDPDYRRNIINILTTK